MGGLAEMRVLVLAAMVLSPFWALPATAEPSSEKQITRMAFYESFNMRTIGSAMWQNLRAYCDSYPKTFFEIKKSVMTILRYHEVKISFGMSIFIMKIP
ncbi:hypothetical protein KAJ83_04615 [Marivibrio halodurans]|uniref:Uncharacterized protein n=1 Tax=Marivibrio halodurans TaxID=2039722 RepID=A0A8J7V2Z4_9PROT|nr:hypothetical protein [Marivibrio halodurans]MBP5856279.1 hypothetical protein [Marivibrio halodurans]